MSCSFFLSVKLLAKTVLKRCSNRSGRRGRPFKYSSSSVGGEAGPTLLETKKTPVVLKKERKDSVLPTSNSTTKRD